MTGDDKYVGNMMLLPGMKMIVGVYDRRGTVTDAAIDKLKSGELVLHIFGEITYEDAFLESHCTQFCFTMNRTLTSFQGCETYGGAT